jgi:hypothetical protein
MHEQAWDFRARVIPFRGCLERGQRLEKSLHIQARSYISHRRSRVRTDALTLLISLNRDFLLDGHVASPVRCQ